MLTFARRVPSRSVGVRFLSNRSRILSTKTGSDFLKIQWEDGAASRFHFLWLRDNCPNCKHPSSQQKLHASTDIPLDVTAKSVSLGEDEVSFRWSDGHESSFSSKWLRTNAYDGVTPELEVPKKTPWVADDLGNQIPSFNYTDVMKNHHGERLNWLMHLHLFGVSHIEGCPIDQKRTPFKALANLVGPLRQSMYGPMWDVVTVENATNLAYTNTPLPLHQDLCYYEAPPGLQFLHCLENEVQGGENAFVDAFKAVAILKEQDPEAFRTLVSTPITYEKIDAENHRQKRRPLISLDEDGEVQAVYHSPPWAGPLKVPFDDVVPFYSAYNKFIAIISNPDLQVIQRTQPGDVFCFDNRRIFHSREKLLSGGKRHLQGCYVDTDDFNSAYRTLRNAYKSKREKAISKKAAQEAS